MSIANIVREARRRSGMTQAELAERAGVPKSTVGRIESGARVPSIDVVPERTNENLNVWPRRSAAWALAFDCSAQFFRNLPPDAIVNMTTNARRPRRCILSQRHFGFLGSEARRDRHRSSRPAAHSGRIPRRRRSLQGSGRPRERPSAPQVRSFTQESCMDVHQRLDDS